MKKILIILLINCFIILTIFKVKANVTTFPLVGKTIIIDSGHGGKDAGASANAKPTSATVARTTFFIFSPLNFKKEILAIFSFFMLNNIKIKVITIRSFTYYCILFVDFDITDI